MATESPQERVKRASARIQTALVQAIAAVVVLVMFGGLAFLVYVDRLDGGALLLYAGVILGYIIHATKQSVQ